VADLIRQEGNRLIVRGVDALDGSPLLDLKAYAPNIDSIPQAINKHTPDALDGTARGEGLHDG
jgi:tRNA (Thr-GGU) A37 N-methylase